MGTEARTPPGANPTLFLGAGEGGGALEEQELVPSQPQPGCHTHKRAGPAQWPCASLRLSTPCQRHHQPGRPFSPQGTSEATSLLLPVPIPRPLRSHRTVRYVCTCGQRRGHTGWEPARSPSPPLPLTSMTRLRTTLLMQVTSLLDHRSQCGGT